MELKEFIKKSIEEIDGALEDVSGKNGNIYKYGKNSSGNPTIDFDIQVYAEDKIIKDGGMGINVAGIKIGANGELNTANYNLSKINFSIVRQDTTKKKHSKKNNIDKFR